jgi:hypothetical protein
MPGKTSADSHREQENARKERLARALRANLKRRKAQARGRSAPDEERGKDGMRGASEQ